MELRRVIKLFIFVTCTTFVFSFNVAADHNPNCATNETDPDNDGWGYENGHSCIVVEPNEPQIVLVGDVDNIDYPFCSELTSSDGKGWSWNGSTGCIAGDMNACAADVTIGADGLGWIASTQTNCYSTVETSEPPFVLVGDVDNIDYPFCSELTSSDGKGWSWNGSTGCIAGDMNACAADVTIGADGLGWIASTQTNCFSTIEASDIPGKFAVDPYGIFTVDANTVIDHDLNNASNYYDGHPWTDRDENTPQVTLNDNFVGTADRSVGTLAPYFADFSANRANLSGTVGKDNHGMEASFRIHCGVSHFQKVDPIVNPGTPSMHLHMFWGNTETDQNSHVNGVGKAAEANLAENGQSNCQGGPYNRSAYWMPALLDSSTGTDKVVIPNDVFIYYKAKVRTQLGNVENTSYRSPGDIEKINPLPMGIQLLGGNINMPGDEDYYTFDGNIIENGTILPDGTTTALFSNAMVNPDDSRHDLDFVNWGCYSGEGIPHKLEEFIPSSEQCRTSTSPNTSYVDGNTGETVWNTYEPGCSNATTRNADNSCKRFTFLEAQIRFPQCLKLNPDGITPMVSHLDNVSHMYARLSYNATGDMYCPDTHPYRIPQITYRVRFHIPGSQNWEAESNLNSGGPQYTYSSRQQLEASKGTKLDTLKNYRLSSDDHVGDARPVVTSAEGLEVLNPAKRGWSLHGDWLGAWNDELVKHWINKVDSCFTQDTDMGSENPGWNRKGKNCANGQMGSSFGLRHFIGTHLKGKSMKYDGHNHPEGWTRTLGAP